MKNFAFLSLFSLATVCSANILQETYTCDAKYGPVEIVFNKLSPVSVEVKVKIHAPGLAGKLERQLTGIWDYSNDTQSAFGSLTKVTTDDEYPLQGGVGIAKFSGNEIQLISTGFVSFNKGVAYGGAVKTVACRLK